MAATVRKIRRLRKVRCTVALVIFIMLMMLVLGGYHKAAGADTARPINSVIVYPGDTLWSLVQEHYMYEGDIRQAIYEVKQLNGLANANIIPGQVLQIPQE